jgi:hypothetical protein
MADVGIQWLNGAHNQFNSLEEAMLSVEPGASGSLYCRAERIVKWRRIYERSV